MVPHHWGRRTWCTSRRSEVKVKLRIGFESDAGGREIESEDHLHHHDWKVLLRTSWSISAPTVGKTVDMLYQKVGHYLENIVDRCLDRKGTVGPDFVSANIKAYFGSGTGEERYRVLCEMRGSFPYALELDCMKLMKYTRRTAAPETQHLAFMIIVDLGTLFPGLRELFLRSKCMRDAQSSLIYVSGLEDRTEATEWGFWQALAATYLSDTTIAHILEKRNAEEWGDWEMQSAGTCTLHHLLNQYNVRASESTKALCVRYVGSVLELPSFWAKKKGLNERTPGQIAARLCSMLMHVLEDLDIREVEPQSLSLNLDWSFDTDGADRFAKVFLTGISDWFSENDDENRAQPWFNKLEKVVSFLRGPRSAKLLPISSTLARSAAFQHRLPASWKIVDFDGASSSLNLDAKGNTSADTPFANPLHREGVNRDIQAGRNSAGENEIEMQSSGSESVEHQTLNAQPSTFSSVSSSDSESAATSESQSQTVFSHRNSLEQNTETGGDLESGAGALDEEDEDNDADADDNDSASPSGSIHSTYPDGLISGSDIPQKYRAEVDRWMQWTTKGDPIHQQLMPKKMQKLDESTDFPPLQLAAEGYPEEKIPMKKVRNYLWRQPLILSFNEDGKKAKSKGNHIWKVEAKKLGDGVWDFRPFHRKIAGSPPGVAYSGLLWKWQPRIWDPQACWQNVHVQYSSPNLPAWLQWKDDVLSGTPPPNAESCDITTRAKFTLDGQDGMLTRTFFLNIAPAVSPENPFAVTFGRVKMVLESETQLPGELGRQKHLLEQTVHACLDDLDAVPDSGFGTAPENHELASVGQDVVARAAAYIVRKAAPAGAAVMHTNASAMQNVNTEELVNTTKDAIAEALQWAELSSPTVLMPSPPECKWHLVGRYCLREYFVTHATSEVFHSIGKVKTYKGTGAGSGTSVALGGLEDLFSVMGSVRLRLEDSITKSGKTCERRQPVVILTILTFTIIIFESLRVVTIVELTIILKVVRIVEVAIEYMAC
ncbi:hypothetical protein B0H14DRAFT_2560905 [Mycena olivaceomarginata]|nr:hypothetical protein B0H14DRAFT_2560905 [Mycena olivaceomarginata]